MRSARPAAAILLAALALAAPTGASGQSGSPDTFFVRDDAIAWGLALAASAATTRVDSRIAHFFQDSARQHRTLLSSIAAAMTHVQETTLTLGGLASYGVARLARARGAEAVSVHVTEAVVAASLSNQVIRGPLGRSRPHVTHFDDPYDFHFMQGFRNFAYRAFPSIHSSSSFAAATVITAETHRRRPGAAWVVAPVVYTIAAGPAYARMYLGQHWASDILMGAFVGTFYGLRIVDYAHAHPDNPVDRRFLGRSSDRTPAGAAPSRLGFTYSFRF